MTLRPHRSNTLRGEPGEFLRAWERTLRRNGEARAVVEAANGRTCTFSELDQRASAWLEAQQIEMRHLAGRAVVFALPNGIAWLEIFLGLRRAGAIAVPMDPGEPVASQQRVAESLRAGFWWDGSRLQPLDRGRRFRAPSTCLIKLTSGTTGLPRPLVFSEQQVLADAHNITRTMDFNAADLNYALIPLGHSYGLGNLTVPLFAQGVPLVCGRVSLPHGIAEDFEAWRPTVFPSVPAVFRALAGSDVKPSQLASLRVPISAGAVLPVQVARDFEARFGRRLHGFYGSSETGGITYDPSGAETLRGGVGGALKGVTMTRLSGGRLRVCSAAVVTYGNARRCNGLGCWTPPDRVDMDAQGRITLLGRRGTSVKIAGRRVSLAEIAARLRRLRGVTDVWVGVGGGAELSLGAALASSRSVMELRAELQADTASWKIPKKWLVVPALPISSRGKIDARLLQIRVFGAARPV